MMSKRLTFLGTDGSLGYRTGSTYYIKIFNFPDGTVAIERTDGTGYCIYSNVIRFLENWGE